MDDAKFTFNSHDTKSLYDRDHKYPDDPVMNAFNVSLQLIYDINLLYC
jgi:hypothetical protein